MKNAVSLILLLAMLAPGCVDHEIESPVDSFVFGRYYGYCAGDCFHAFVVKENSLYQSENETYPSKDAPWSLPSLRLLSEDQKALVADLPSLIPQSLLNTSETVIGCPDCGDFGAIYIELNQNGNKRFWYVDNAIQEQELKDFITTIHERINLLVN
ncbi:MAG TPA: hypothetical protein VGD65_15750 [Chryseosolibacter sp.]